MVTEIEPPVTSKKVIVITLTFSLGLLVTIIVCLFWGTAHISPHQLFSIIIQREKINDPSVQILFNLRLPRILFAGIVGYALALGGVVFQALLRNPLADPFILGVSSGAGFGAVVAIMLGLGFHLGVPILAFIGATLSIITVMLIGRKEMGTESSTILLSGVIVNAFLTAVIMFFISTSPDSRLHSMLFWLYGDLSQAKYWPMSFLVPILLVGSFIIYSYARHLNIITVGEDVALHLGVDVQKTIWFNILLVSFLIGAVVSFSGLIGFVGLLVPHLLRMLFGSDHRILIPAASLGGAIFMVIADTIARTIISPNELPVGVVTAFAGAPFFIYLLKTRGSRWVRS